MKTPIAVIAGPTGVGKTALSIQTAKKLDAEIISADSMQIYKRMDIGTAKITSPEMQGVPHHLINAAEPSERFSVYDYTEQCSRAICEISARGKLPLLVGGSGLYIDSVVDGAGFSSIGSDAEYRHRLTLLAEQKGAEYLHGMLEKADPESAEKIHPKNVKRVIRALEYYKTSGEKISEHNKRSKETDPPYSCCYICLSRDRQELYSRIDKRVDAMLDRGLVDEVRALAESGCGRSCTSMQALGYKEVLDYLDGTVSYDEMVETLKRGTRRYAKRQLTWFKRRKEALWINLSETTEADAIQLCTNAIRTFLCENKNNTTASRE